VLLFCRSRPSREAGRIVAAIDDLARNDRAPALSNRNRMWLMISLVRKDYAGMTMNG